MESCCPLTRDFTCELWHMLERRIMVKNLIFLVIVSLVCQMIYYTCYTGTISVFNFVWYDAVWNHSTVPDVGMLRIIFTDKGPFPFERITLRSIMYLHVLGIRERFHNVCSNLIFKDSSDPPPPSIVNEKHGCSASYIEIVSSMFLSTAQHGR